MTQKFTQHSIICLVVSTRVLWLLLDLYFTPSIDYELTHFGTTDLHDLQTGFHSIDFCRLKTSLKYQPSPVQVLQIYFRALLHESRLNKSRKRMNQT